MEMKLSLNDLSSEIQNKLKNLKFMILDIDGVLTDGNLIWMGKETGWSRFFCVYDGYGMLRLQRSGIECAVISAGKSQDVLERMKWLEVKEVHMGISDKLAKYEEIKAAKSLNDDEVGYMADEIFDLPLLKQVGLSVSVPNGMDEVKENVDFVVKTPGGKGAVRELVDLVLAARET